MPDRLCEFPGCSAAHYALGLCERHYQQQRAGKELTNEVRQPRSYRSMHSSLRHFRGRAKDHPCTQCGKQAEEWSYDGGCSDERADDERGRTWCPHYDHYSPRCHDCHQQMPVKKGRRTTAKLTDDEVREIRRTHAAGGVSMTQLGATYGVSLQAVSNIVNRKNTYLDVD